MLSEVVTSISIFRESVSCFFTSRVINKKLFTDSMYSRVKPTRALRHLQIIQALLPLRGDAGKTNVFRCRRGNPVDLIWLYKIVTIAKRITLAKKISLRFCWRVI
jgi:hypothetical protein